MDTTNGISTKKPRRETQGRFSKKSVATAVIAALYLSLSCHTAIAARRITPPDDPPVGDDGGGGGGPIVPPPPFAPNYAAWTTAHGNSDNSGFTKVVTAPATNFTALVDVGPLAPGVNPVTGQDGTVYIGNLNGELIALSPNGTLKWKRQLANPQVFPVYGAMYSSPAVSGDGSIFVVSTSFTEVRDHRNGTDDVRSLRTNTFLHKVTPGGEWLGSQRFPARDYLQITGTGVTTAPPNIWSFNGAEALMIPVYSGPLVHLLAFSTSSLQLLADHPVTQGEVTGGSGWEWWDDFWSGDLFAVLVAGCALFPVACIDNVAYVAGIGLFIKCHGVCGFSTNFTPAPSAFDQAVGSPDPGVAIRQYTANQSPHVFVVDGAHDTVEYTFDINTGFHAIRRNHYDDRTNTSAPVALATSGIVIGKHTQHETLGGVSFEPRYVWLDGDISAAPTITPNDRIVAVHRNGWLSTLRFGVLEKQEWNNGQSIASAASSCTYLYVATENELVTYDLATLQWVNRLPWTYGGRHSTVIGPTGYVYATTEHGIYVFPPVPNRNPTDITGTQCH